MAENIWFFFFFSRVFRELNIGLFSLGNWLSTLFSFFPLISRQPHGSSSQVSFLSLLLFILL